MPSDFPNARPSFEFGLRYRVDLSQAQIGPLGGATLAGILTDGRVLGLLARNMLAAGFDNLESLPDPGSHYSLFEWGQGRPIQTRMLTKAGCDLLMSAMKGVGRRPDAQRMAEWERLMGGWIILDNRRMPRLEFLGLRSIADFSDESRKLSAAAWDRRMASLPPIILHWQHGSAPGTSRESDFSLVSG